MESRRFYNLDYDKAQKEFKEIVRLYPTPPAGPQLLAARLWIKTLYESRRLQSLALQLGSVLFQWRGQGRS